MDHKQPNNCQDPIDLLIDQMESGEFNKNQLEALIQNHPKCKGVLTEHFELWQDLATLEAPIPRAEMSTNFYKKLNEFSAQDLKTSSSKNNFWHWLSNWSFATNPQLGMALGIGLFLFGFFAGQIFQPNGQQKQIDALAEQISHLQKSKDFNVNLTKSVAGRMKDIHFVRQMENPNAKILKALNTAICNDPNINVRLSAIESLVHFSDDPEVMEILIKAIPRQNSSLVQLELAEVMIQLEEKRSAAAWKELLESGEVELDVKMQLEESLQVLL